MALRDEIAAAPDGRERARLKARAFSQSGSQVGLSLTRGPFVVTVTDGPYHEAGHPGTIRVKVRVERDGRDWTPDHLNPIRVTNPPTRDPGAGRQDLATALLGIIRDLPDRLVWDRAADRTGLGPPVEGSTLVIYGDASDGSTRAASATYATARAMGGTVTAYTTELGDPVGQLLSAGTYTCYQLLWAFDSSALSGATVSDAVSDGWLRTDTSTTDFTVNLYEYDFGTTVTTADVVPGATLAGMTPRATLATSGIGASGAYKTFTGNLSAYVNTTGYTRFLLASSRQAGNNAPTGAEHIDLALADTSGTTNDPKLTVTYTTGVTGTAAFVVPVPVVAATGTETITGTSAVTVPVPVIAATGTAILAVTGTSEVTVPVPVIAATGTVIQPVTGTAAFVVPVPVIAATGTETITGTSAISVPVPVLAATGTALLAITGTAAFVVPVPVLTGAGGIVGASAALAATVYARGDLFARMHSVGAGMGIEVEVWDPQFNPPRLIAILEGARRPSWHDALGGVGAFAYAIPLADAKAGPRIHARGNIVKFRLHGAQRFGGFIDQLVPTLSSVAGSAGEWLDVAGPGLAAYMGRARLPVGTGWLSGYLPVMLDSFITDAATRGVLPLLSTDWSATEDSAGVPWTGFANYLFEWGSQTVLDVWSAVIGIGVETRVTPALVLQAYEGGIGSDRSAKVVLREGWHLRADVRPSNRDEARWFNVVYVKGQDGTLLTVYGNHTDQRRGRRETIVDFPATNNAEAKRRAGQAALAEAEAAASALQLPLHHGLADGHYEPFLDYNVGDLVGLRLADAPRVVRIAAITITGTEGGGFEVDVDTGVVTVDNMVRLKRLIESNANQLIRVAGL